MPRLSLRAALVAILLVPATARADTILVGSGVIDLNKEGGFVAQDGTVYQGVAHLWTSSGYLVATWAPVDAGFWDSWTPGRTFDSTLELRGFRIPTTFETTDSGSRAVMRFIGETPQLYWSGSDADGASWGMYGVPFQMRGTLDVPSTGAAGPIAGWGFAYLRWRQPARGASDLDVAGFAFGRPSPPVPVPEPSSLTLVLVGGITLFRAARVRCCRPSSPAHATSHQPRYPGPDQQNR